MASATVICAECGENEFTIHGRNRRDADYQAKKMEDRGWKCRDCQNKETAKENAAAGLPKLKGSEKQVTWAETIRARILPIVDVVIDQAGREDPDILYGAPGFGDVPKVREILRGATQAQKDDLVAAIRAIDSAHEWIERRDTSIADLIKTVAERRVVETEINTEERKAELAAEREMRAEATIVPTEPKTASIAELSWDQFHTIMKISMPEKNETLRQLLKSRSWRWNDGLRSWVEGGFTVEVNKIRNMVDIARALLAEGIPVCILDEEVRSALVEGTAPEREWKTIRLRLKGRDEGWLVAEWPRFAGDFYDAFRRIKGSKYAAGKCIAPITSADEIADFARIHGFEISEAAQEAIEHYRELRSRGITMAVAKVEVMKPAPNKHKPDYIPSTMPRSMSIMNFSTTTDLLPHQIDAVAKLLPTRVGGLFAEMGTGKSRILIEIAKLRAAKGKVSRVVWFCPTSIKSTIVFEILRHTDCIPDDIHAFDDTTRSDTVPLDRFWYVVGIEGLGQSARIVAAFDKLLDDRAFVVVDESSYIKGPRAKRTQLVTHMSARARYRMAMTGTPLTQGVVDLYAQMYFLSPKILGYNSFYSFAANHLEYRVDRRTGKRTGQIVQAHNTHVLAKKVAPYVYQITKDECLDLPEKLFHCHGTTATAQQREYYEAAKNEFLDIEPDDVKDFDVFRLFSTLQAVSAGYHKGERLDSYRIAGLCDVLRTIRAPEKVVVWTKYRLALEDIRTALAAEYGEDAVQIFHGGLSAQEKDDNLAMWRASGRFLLATQASGGHGLTLVDANTAVFFANSFKFSERAQAEDRIHRIGQRRPCTYVDIVSNLGIDSRIGGALSNKEGTLQSFRDKLDLYRKLGLKAKIREAVMAL